MRFKKILMFAALALFSIIRLNAQEVKQISLKESLKIGFENSKTLKISKSKINAASSKIEESKAGGLPSLKFLGAYTRLSDIDPVKLGNTVIPSILNNYTLKLTAAQPIFTGNRIESSVSLAEHNEKASMADLEKDNAQLAFDIKNAYWNLKKAFDMKKSILENISQVKAHIGDIESFEKNGLATLNDVLKVKIQLSNLELNKLDIDIMIETSQINFATLIGAPSSSNFSPSDEANYSDISSLDLNNLKKDAYSKRAELKAFAERIKASDNGITMSKAGWYPQINASANYNYLNPNSRIMFSGDKFKGTWDVGISLTYDIWNWQITSRQAEQAEATKEQAELGMLQFKDALDLDVTSSYLNLKKAYEKIALTMETIKQAEENYRTLNERFKNGAALSSDLLDAETALLQAKISYSSSLCDYEVANAKLIRSIGN